MAGSEEAVRFRVLVAERMLQLVAQEGGSDAKFVLLLRQLAAKFTRMKPASSEPPCFHCHHYSSYVKGYQGFSTYTNLQEEVQ